MRACYEELLASAVDGEVPKDINTLLTVARHTTNAKLLAPHIGVAAVLCGLIVLPDTRQGPTSNMKQLILDTGMQLGENSTTWIQSFGYPGNDRKRTTDRRRDLLARLGLVPVLTEFGRERYPGGLVQLFKNLGNYAGMVIYACQTVNLMKVLVGERVLGSGRFGYNGGRAQKIKNRADKQRAQAKKSKKKGKKKGKKKRGNKVAKKPKNGKRSSK